MVWPCWILSRLRSAASVSALTSRGRSRSLGPRAGLRRRRAHEVDRLGGLQIIRGNHGIAAYPGGNNYVRDVRPPAAQYPTQATRQQTQAGIRDLRRDIENARERRAHAVTRFFAHALLRLFIGGSRLRVDRSRKHGNQRSQGNALG